MVEGIVVVLAAVAVLVNALILLSVYTLGKGKENGADHYFVLNMALLNTFMAGVVIYGIINL